MKINQQKTSTLTGSADMSITTRIRDYGTEMSDDVTETIYTNNPDEA